MRSDDKGMVKEFYQYRPYALNIFRTIDRDTIGEGKGLNYTCKIHIEPTSDRIIKSTYNNEGIEVDNMYLDNEARLKVTLGSEEIYSHSFRKQEFSAYVPEDFMSKSIIRDILYSHADTSAVFFDAIIGIPDA